MANCSQHSQSLLPDSSSFSEVWPSPSVTALRVNTSSLLRQARRPPLHLVKAVSFSVYVQEKVRGLSLTFLKSFTSKVRNDLAESLEINTLQTRRIEAALNGLPCLTTSHECPKMLIL